MDSKPAPPDGAKKDEVDAKGTEVNAAAVAPSTEATKTAPAVDDVSDPDEDDLDDLDDMLGEFSSVKLQGETEAAAAADAASAGPNAKSAEATPKGPQAASASGEEELSEDMFAKQLQAGMADLLGELENSPEMQNQFEDMFKQMAAAATGEPVSEGTGTPSGASRSAGLGAGAASDASFQDTIRRTMDRMQASGEQATAAASAAGTDDFMTELLKQMSSGDLNAEGSEEEFSKMLMGMMEQLTNKEILYEPMKELDDKFPEWFEKNKDSTPADDLKRYEEQKGLVREIVAKFEETTYSDDNAADREYIVDRMQKMQAAGSPPSDLVGDMASAQEAFNAPDEQCNPQ